MAEHEHLDEVLRDDYLAGLEARSADELRDMRVACEAEEDRVSYARRVVQGRLDIVRAEAARRQGSGDDDAAELLDALPEILAGDHRPTELGRRRSTPVIVPDEPGDAESVGDEAHGDLHAHSTAELAQLIDELKAREHELSTTRRALFDRLDAITAELADRYRSGTADVRDVLP